MTRKGRDYMVIDVNLHGDNGFIHDFLLEQEHEKREREHDEQVYRESGARIHPASIVAKIILKFLNHEDGNTISNMHLQRLLYYVQGHYLAKYNLPAFEEDMEAWWGGPVVPAVYNEYSEFGYGAIESELNYDIPISVTYKQKKLIYDVCHIYGDFSASKLGKMVCSESPWCGVKTGAGHIISKRSIMEYFKSEDE